MIGQLLFSHGLLYDVLESRKKQMLAEIEQEDANYILNVNFSDFCNHIVQKYSLDLILLDETEITVGQQEVRVGFTTGTRVTYFVPFRGAADLFQYRSSTYTFNPPRGIVNGQVLELSFDGVNGSADQIKKEFDRALTEIKRWIGWITNEVQHFNEQLLTLIEERTKARREKLLRDQGLVAELGFPIKKRENAPTNAVPEIKRKISPKPQASTEPFKPEPALPVQEYDHILSIIESMSLVMERSPKAFRQ